MEGRGYQIRAFPAQDDKQMNRILVHNITYNPLSKISTYVIVKCAVGANTTSLHSVPHYILCHSTMSIMDIQQSHLSLIINISLVLQ